MPHISNVSFGDVHGEGLLISLDLKGVAAATGAACSSGSVEPSHVLVALGIERERIHGSLRFSLAESNTLGEIDDVLEILVHVIERLRVEAGVPAGSGA